MIAELEKVMKRVNQLPVSEQNNIAFFWEQDLDSELEFDNKILNSIDQLRVLAQDALNEFHNGTKVG
jgi:hypothetical protein